ncbi:MAG: alkane 1-monooxygenase [Pseudomonadota bacterium]
MLIHALPFVISFLMIPAVVVGGINGGWFLSLPFLLGWVLVPLLDRLTGLNIRNLDPTLPDDKLIWHRAITLAWVPSQIGLILWCIWLIGTTSHLSTIEIVFFALALGTATGGIGITYAHEMIHQAARSERWCGELLLVSTSYGPFATEHVYGHHITVATPKDPVTALRGEGFYLFFLRAVAGTMLSAWRLDRGRLARRELPIWHRTNPFWRYGFGTALFCLAAYGLAGWLGVAFFFLQSIMAIYQLEAVNYVEHYGLTREYLGGGKFERVKPHHSWNASQAVSNWFLINLQRHSDHHYRPRRRFPLLQHYSWSEAPQLPFGYATMIAIAIIPPLWFYLMDKRLDRWREKFYPHITDWSAYDTGMNGSHESVSPDLARA